MKLLPNRSAKINLDTPDYFDHERKGLAIKYFLENAKGGFSGNNMIVLFGGWGSGKSTLMERLERKLDKKLFKTVFFTAWEHEKDKNLALSLVDAITIKLEKNNEVKEFIKEAAALLINLTKGITIKVPDYLGVGFEYNFKNTLEAIDKYYEEEENNWSFYKRLTDFKEKYLEMEKKVLEPEQKLIIFIDDLDRCEPENILTLLSAIKLFFSLGERTIFFFGVDKKAVTSAVKTKYGDLIKSEEYMEKVFDISFEMPKNTSIYSLAAHYFPTNKFTGEIVGFFQSIDFTNPRHLKKVLNKYMVIRTFKDNILGNEMNKLIPSILDERDRGSVMETIFTLFIIILYEYYYEIFEELENYKSKVAEYARIYERTSGNKNIIGFNLAFSAITNDFAGCCFSSIDGTMISELIRNSTDIKVNPQNPNDHSTYKRFIKFLTLFTPKEIEKIELSNPNAGRNESEFLKQFDNGNNKLLINFCFFILQNKENILKMDSTYRFSDIFLMARTIL